MAVCIVEVDALGVDDGVDDERARDVLVVVGRVRERWAKLGGPLQTVRVESHATETLSPSRLTSFSFLFISRLYSTS